MIRSFRHKGLEQFFLAGSVKGIQPQHAQKLQSQLGALHAAGGPEDMRIPGWKLHRLKGGLKDFWSVTVNGNWRLIFRFADKDADLVDYLDYH